MGGFNVFWILLIYFLHELSSQYESLDLWDIGGDFFRIISESDIFHFCSFLQCDLRSLHCEFSSELDSISRCECVAECIGDDDIFHGIVGL